MDMNITDYSLPADSSGNYPVKTLHQLLSRENAKCQTGLSGLEDNFSVQMCILGSTCGNIPSCFSERRGFSPLSTLFTVSNLEIDRSIKQLVQFPTDGDIVEQFMVPGGAGTNIKGKQVIGALAESGVIAALVAALGAILVDLFKSLILPKLAEGLTAALSALIGAISAQVWMALSVVIAIGALVWVVKDQVAVLVKIIKDAFWPQPLTDKLIMQSWNPFEGQPEPKCEWVNYFDQSCSNRNTLLKEYW
jgi:hypothetical protein